MPKYPFICQKEMKYRYHLDYEIEMQISFMLSVDQLVMSLEIVIIQESHIECSIIINNPQNTDKIHLLETSLNNVQPETWLNLRHSSTLDMAQP